MVCALNSLTLQDSDYWYLPRPPKSRYPGGFPLHFESMLMKLLHHPYPVLQPFGGRASVGIRCDLNPETSPDYICDAHDLPFDPETFMLVILDPPYNDAYSEDLYKTGKLNFTKYTAEAVRVLKPGGFLVVYHGVSTPYIKGVELRSRIALEIRPWHTLRSIRIYQKPGSSGRNLASSFS